MNKIIKNNDGLTLVEMIIATTILSIIMIGIFTIMSQMTTSLGRSQREVQVQDELQTSYSIISTTMKEAQVVDHLPSDGNDREPIYITNNVPKQSKQVFIFTPASGATRNLIDKKYATDKAYVHIIDYDYDSVKDTGTLYLHTTQYNPVLYGVNNDDFSSSSFTTSMQALYNSESAANKVRSTENILAKHVTSFSVTNLTGLYYTINMEIKYGDRTAELNQNIYLRNSEGGSSYSVVADDGSKIKEFTWAKNKNKTIGSTAKGAIKSVQISDDTTTKTINLDNCSLNISCGTFTGLQIPASEIESLESEKTYTFKITKEYGFATAKVTIKDSEGNTPTPEPNDDDDTDPLPTGGAFAVTNGGEGTIPAASNISQNLDLPVRYGTETDTTQTVTKTRNVFKCSNGHEAKIVSVENRQYEWYPVAKYKKIYKVQCNGSGDHCQYYYNTTESEKDDLSDLISAGKFSKTTEQYEEYATTDFILIQNQSIDNNYEQVEVIVYFNDDSTYFTTNEDGDYLTGNTNLTTGDGACKYYPIKYNSTHYNAMKIIIPAISKAEAGEGSSQNYDFTQYAFNYFPSSSDGKNVICTYLVKGIQ